MVSCAYDQLAPGPETVATGFADARGTEGTIAIPDVDGVPLFILFVFLKLMVTSSLSVDSVRKPGSGFLTLSNGNPSKCCQPCVPVLLCPQLSLGQPTASLLHDNMFLSIIPTGSSYNEGRFR